MAQCKATSKRSGKRCRRHAMKSKAVCHMHGGKSLAGVDHGQFVSGRYSKYLPDSLAFTYHEALANKDLISMNDEIALIDTRLATMLDRAAGVAVGSREWRAAREHFQSFRAHTNAGRQVRAIEALDRLGGLLMQPQSDDAAWHEIVDLIEARRKLADTERKRLLDEDQVITIDRLMILMAALVDIVRRNVASREERAAVSDEVRLLVSGSQRPS